MSSRRGFSLIEVMIALSIAAILSTAILGILLNALETSRRTRLRSEAASAGNLLAQQLRQDLRQAGLGVPTGVNVSTGADNFYASVLVASPTEVGVMADLPRPDANYNTFGLLDDRPAGSEFDRHVSWHTENNGACMPQTTAPSCSTADSSMFFPGEPSELCATAAAAQAPDRTCPWGLKRLRGGEPFQVVAGNRQFFSATNNASLTVHNHGLNGVLVIDTGNTFPVSWANAAGGSLPAGGTGQGWVTTIDRVFFRFVAATKTVERIQCFGAPDVTNALWPAANAVTAGGAPCANPFQGMAAWEPIARDVKSVTFSYFDKAGTLVAQPINTAAKKASVRRIDFAIVFEKTTSGQKVRHEVTSGVALTML